MKRVDLIRHLESQGCRQPREGANHSVYVNPAVRKSSTVPKHREIDGLLACRVCRDLQIVNPGV